MLTTLALDTITVEPDFQVRPLQQDVVDHYADIFAELPPIVVFRIEDVFVVAAGHHRLAAARELDLETFAVDLREGTRAEALVFALTSNAKHGLPLTKEEERQAILRLAALETESIGEVSARGGRGLTGGVSEIARQMGRSQHFVDTVLRAERVRTALPFTREIPGIFTPTKLEAISRAPAETWEPLATSFREQQLRGNAWTEDEIYRRVRDVNAGKPIDEVVTRPAPQYIPPTQPTPDPEHDNLDDYMELSRAIGRFAPYLSVGRYDWRDVPRDEGSVMLMQLGMMRIQIEKIMAFLLGEGFEPAAPDAENTALQEVYAQ